MSERGTLDALLRPRSVAVVGASAERGKRGNLAVRTLLADGYAGAIHPVHPRGGELLGLPVTRSVAELRHGVDLAVICTPAATVPELIVACGEAGIRGAVVLALGFGEIGGAGHALEAELRRAIAASGVRVVGPNTSGLANPRIGLNLFGVGGLRAGGLGVVAQSGNVLLGVMLDVQRRPALGLSVCVGVGNAVDVTPAEYLAWLAEDANTRAVALYVEGIGDGRAFLEAAAHAAARKPVVLLKGGRSQAGQSAAKSHTGALSGEYAVLRAALREAGVLEIERSDEFFPLAEALAAQGAAASGGLGVLSDGGGHATLTADYAEQHGVALALLSEPCRAALRARLGDAACVTNPVDLAGAADRDPLAFADAAAAMLAEPGVGALLLVGLFGGYAERFSSELADAELAAAGRIAAAAKGAGKALVVHSMYADTASAALSRLRAEGVPVHASLELACRCAAEPLHTARRMERARIRIERGAARDATSPEPRSPLSAGIREPELRALLERYGVPLAPAVFCGDAAAASAAALAVAGGQPVALRVVAGGVSHKTEVGGVRLNVDATEVADVFEEMRASVSAHGTVHGALVSPMLSRPVAELLVGVRSDPVFGRVLAVGAGGTAAEVLRDVVLRVPPLEGGDVAAMLAELRTAPLLEGWRGGAAADRQAVVEAALALLTFAGAHPEVSEVEINPLFVYEHGAVAVDVRAYVAGEAAPAAGAGEGYEGGEAGAVSVAAVRA